MGVIRTAQSGWQPYWLIRIDADAATGIATYDWAHGLAEGDRAGLLRQGQGMPYAMRPGAKDPGWLALAADTMSRERSRQAARMSPPSRSIR